MKMCTWLKKNEVDNFNKNDDFTIKITILFILDRLNLFSFSKSERHNYFFM